MWRTIFDVGEEEGDILLTNDFKKYELNMGFFPRPYTHQIS